MLCRNLDNGQIIRNLLTPSSIIILIVVFIQLFNFSLTLTALTLSTRLSKFRLVGFFTMWFRLGLFLGVVLDRVSRPLRAQGRTGSVGYRRRRYATAAIVTGTVALLVAGLVFLAAAFMYLALNSILSPATRYAHLLSEILVETGRKRVHGTFERRLKFWRGMRPVRFEFGGVCSCETKELLLLLWFDVITQLTSINHNIQVKATLWSGENHIFVLTLWFLIKYLFFYY